MLVCLTGLCFTAPSRAATLTFTAAEDAYIDNSGSTVANTNFGSQVMLRVKNVQNFLLKFSVSGVGLERVTSAKIRLHCNDASSAGGNFQLVANNSWTEAGVTWNNAPAGSSSPTLPSLGSVSSGSWYEVDVTPAVIADGTFSFRVSASASTNIAGYDSREVSGLEPQLVLVTKPVLPLEVIGGTNYTVGARVDVASATGVDTLYVEGHRLGYEDGLSPLSGQTKASVRVNGGSWIALTNATTGITVFQPELSYGGIGGGYNTVRLTVPVTGVVTGSNLIEFKFSGTDGITSGFRVLDLNLLQGSTFVLPTGTFVYDDPALWTAPLPGAGDISAGQTLWYQQNILSNPGGGSIKASCSMCHAQDGRDLKYFNYSNWSIVQRARDHSLSQTQAEQIASYIRSLTTPAPAAARPWNPPYQPGPGIDALPVTEWAAGAGLAAVLDSDNDMAATLFPVGANIDTIAAVTGTLNLREQKVAVQFPDWNAWLPAIHPVDIWSDSGTVPWTTSKANQAYLTLRAALPGQLAPTAGKPDATLPTTVGKLDDGVRNFISDGRTDTTGQGNWRTLTGTTVDAIPSGIGLEKGKLNLSKWMGVKNWEVMQEFAMEAVCPTALPPSAQGTRGEVRGWPSDGQSVWANAPHMTATNKANFSGQGLANGTFLSSVWYQLQMTVNAGMRQVVDTTPVDWGYQFLHLTRLKTNSGQPQSLRYAQSMIKAYQMRYNGQGPAILGWQLRFLHPWALYSDEAGSTALFDDMNTARAGLRVQVLNSQLTTFMDMITTDSQFALSAWPRRASATDYNNTTHEYWYALEPVSFAPTAAPPTGDVFTQPNYNHANAFYRLIPRLGAAGVSSTVIQRVVDWCKLAWPNPVPTGAWDALAPDTASPTVTLTAPANGATVTGTVALTATASDNVGIVGVQFKRDGVNISTEDVTYPYSRNWNTTSISKTTHTLTAVARDAAGNVVTSSSITVTVQ